jgi:hypothetical protein
MFTLNYPQAMWVSGRGNTWPQPMKFTLHLKENSPYGDHDRRRTAFASLGIVGRLLAVIPWGHLLLERQILKRHSELRGESLASMHDLNLNKLKVGEFRDKVVAAGFEIDSLRFNQGSSKIGKIFAVGRRLPGMETYCTYNLYCKLRYAVDSSK